MVLTITISGFFAVWFLGEEKRREKKKGLVAVREEGRGGERRGEEGRGGERRGEEGRGGERRGEEGRGEEGRGGERRGEERRGEERRGEERRERREKAGKGEGKEGYPWKAGKKLDQAQSQEIESTKLWRYFRCSNTRPRQTPIKH